MFSRDALASATHVLRSFAVWVIDEFSTCCSRAVDAVSYARCAPGVRPAPNSARFSAACPSSPDAVRPFLFNLFNDPAILRIPGVFRTPLAYLLKPFTDYFAKAFRET